MENDKKDDDTKIEDQSMKKMHEAYIQSLKDKHRPMRTKIYGYMILLYLYILYQYLIVPLAFLIQLIFITSDHVQETNNNTTLNLMNGLSIGGFLIIFAVPLIPFFIYGFKLVLIQQSFVMYCWTTIVLLLECILNVPLTFLHSDNIFSIFLYAERGFNQTLNPWLVFYPTIYVKSWIEIIRHLIEGLYFFIVGIIVYNSISANIIFTFSISTALMLIVLCILKILALVGIIVYKFMTKEFYKNEMKGDKKTQSRRNSTAKEN